MKASEALRRIFTHPRAVFTALQQDRKWVSAVIFMVFLLAIHAFVVAIGTYSENRDGSQIDAQPTVAASAPESEPDESDKGGQDSNLTRPDTTVESTKIGSNRGRDIGFGVWLLIMVALLPVGFGLLCLLCLFDAVYFRIVSAILKLDIRLDDWFALSVWSRVPGIALIVLSVIVGLIAFGRQPNSEELEILSLARWVELPEVHYGGENWNISVNLDRLDAHLIWIIALQTIGFQQWSGKSATLSLGVALVPTLVLFATALSFILLA